MIDPILISTEYTLIIDTNSFSDGFSKQLCAYCTGISDENDIGQKYAEMFYEDRKIEDDSSPKGRVSEEKNPFYGFIAQRLDEEQLYSPCCVWLNKKYGYNAEGNYALLTEENFEDYNFPAPLSVGIFFEEKPEDEQIQMIKQRTLKFFESIWESKNPVVVEGFRLIIHTKYGQDIEI
jgi:hypothetical protein